MKLLAAALLLLGLAKAAPAATTPPPTHPHTYPSCEGIALVPGYDQCGHKKTHQ